MHAGALPSPEEVFIASNAAAFGDEALQVEFSLMRKLEHSLRLGDLKRETIYPVNYITPRRHTAHARGVTSPSAQRRAMESVEDKSGAP
jgi:hypothetical protein